MTPIWGPVPGDPTWMLKQTVFCLTSPNGAIDIFRAVAGLEHGFDACLARAVNHHLSNGENIGCISDVDMLRCQEALPEAYQKTERVRALRAILELKEESK